MENKTVRVTKTQRFADIIAMLNGESVKFGTSTADAIAFCEHEVELLAKKNASVDKRKSAEQEKNDGYKYFDINDLVRVSLDPDHLMIY